MSNFKKSSKLNNPDLLSKEIKDKSSYKNIKNTYGTFDSAGVFSVLANSSQNRRLPILGIPDNNQSLLATYPDRDSVAIYVENTGVPDVSCLNGVVYGANTVTTTDDVSSCKVGMIIDTLHTPHKYSGIVNNIIGKTIYVSAWYKVDDVTLTPQTPPNTAGFIINPITKVWGINNNVYLPNTGGATSMAGIELGLWHSKVGGTAWGVDVVSFGSQKPQYGFVSRRVGSQAGKIQKGFYSENSEISFESYQDGDNQIAFKASVNNGVQNWFVTSNGTQNKLKVNVQQVGNGITTYTDINQTAFLFTNTTALNFTPPAPNELAGKMVFFYNAGSADVTLTGTGFSFAGRNANSANFKLQSRCFAIFMSNGSTLYFPVSTNVNNVIEASSAPAGVPNFIGQEYIDKTNKKIYKAIGTASVDDWILLN